MAYNIIIADDHPPFREILGIYTKANFPVGKIAEVNNGIAVLELLDQCSWDLILLDINMPEMGGFEVLKRLENYQTVPPVIVISFHVHLSRQAAKLGAKGYLPKDFNPSDFEIAVNAVLSGGSYFPLLNKEYEGPKLNSQEILILALICQEKTTKEIAERLCLGENTIETYRKSLMEKTESKNMAGLVLFAISNGFQQV